MHVYPTGYGRPAALAPTRFGKLAGPKPYVERRWFMPEMPTTRKGKRLAGLLALCILPLLPYAVRLYCQATEIGYQPMINSLAEHNKLKGGMVFRADTVPRRVESGLRWLQQACRDTDKTLEEVGY